MTIFYQWSANAKISFLIGFFLLFLTISIARAQHQEIAHAPDNAAASRAGIAAEMEYSLMHELLNPWYPKAVDKRHGGFLSDFSSDFKPVGPHDKMIVTQARHTWVNAKAAQRYPAVKEYLENARHGFLFLKNTMWDKTYGGFHTLVDRKGKPKKGSFADKEAYGNAFAIYALAAYYKASGDPEALDLARKTFLWLEKFSHDPVHKGYFQRLHRNGAPVARTPSTPPLSRDGYKDQNSSIHLLEAFTELYEVWPDPLLKERLYEILTVIRDTIVTPKGNLTLFLQPDWTPVSFVDSSKQVILQHAAIDHISFGHDVETAYLLFEASHILGLREDTATLNIGKKMVDHALQNGWDAAVGGFYDQGYYFKGDDKLSIIKDTKNWWAQAEGLNSLLLMANLYPDDPTRYFDKFTQLWQYVKTYLIDHEHGEWYDSGLDKDPEAKARKKGHIWKAAYHSYRSLTNCIRELQTPTPPR